MDIHTHSEHSFDGEFSINEMCMGAKNRGIPVFAITDHYDISGFELSFPDLDASIKKSVESALAAKASFKDAMLVLLGIELGQPLENLAKADELLSCYPFDFVLCAMHNLPNRNDFYYYDPADLSFDLDKELEAYFIHLLDTVHWGRFDSIAHITYPFRYILERNRSPYPFMRWDDYVETILIALVNRGLALELNTSGISKNPSYTMPDPRWIKRFKELGGEKVTIGSDAHSPQRIGSGIPQGMEMIENAGFKHLCYFVERAPRFVNLADCK
jgi:histidinol-phosphatase (PHP family)